MKIISEGKVKVNEINKGNPYFFEKTKVMLIDLHTKRAEVGIMYSNNIPHISLCPSEDSVHLVESKNEFTDISFPEYEGWMILMAQVVKYSLYITFAKVK